MLLVAVFLGFLGGVEVDAVVLAGELGAVGAVDDHGIAVADERRILARGRLAAGGIGRDGQRLAVGRGALSEQEIRELKAILDAAEQQED